MMTNDIQDKVTAALLVIGDEILSGRTKDKNIGYIAEYLTAIGIDLKEVRVVSDDEAAIVEEEGHPHAPRMAGAVPEPCGWPWDKRGGELAADPEQA